MGELSHLSHGPFYEPAVTLSSARLRRSQTPPEESAPAPDRPLAFDDKDATNLPLEVALVMVIGTLLPYLGFCWWLILISLPVTSYYTKFVINSFRPPNRGVFSLEMTQFAIKTILHLTLLAAMLYWCLSITPFHIFAPTAMDALTPYTVHDALNMTEVVYDPGHSASVDIFAIHGLGSTPESAWTYRLNETKVRWLSELLPQTIGFQDARIIKVNHQTRWDSNAAHMEFNDHASGLLEHIESQHKDNPHRPIIFIAHSFGGLLLKKALLLAKFRSRDVATMTKGIIFLGVPHRGTYAAFVAACLSCTAFFRGSSSSLNEFMTVDGQAILGLESEFYDGYVLPYNPYEPQLYICDVLEMRSERMGKLALGPVVRPKHGLLRHGRIITLDTDHRGLNKFHSHDDPNYQIFVRTLLEAKGFALQPNPFLDPPVSCRLHPQNESPTYSPDFLEFLSSGKPWAISNRMEAFALASFQEFLASWLARDRNQYGILFTSRIPKMALYECFVGVSIGQALCWLVFKLFQGCTSFEARLLQIVIVPIQRTFSQFAQALIAGARTYHQVRATIRVSAMPTLELSLVLYPICSLIAYLFLPPHTWTAFFHAVLVLLYTYMNTTTKIKRLNVLRKLHGRMTPGPNGERGNEGGNVGENEEE